jgi:general stress protein 26
MRAIDIGMLTTSGTLGRLHSRPMAAHGNIDDDGTLWLFTANPSTKVAEFAQHPAVNVAFADPVRAIFVSVAGTARLIDDRAILARRWRPELERWFPAGLDEPELALIQVIPEEAEYWEAPSRVTTLVFGHSGAEHGAIRVGP